MTKLCISIFLPDLRGGGAERVMVDLAQGFKLLGHTVEFVLMQATGNFLTEAQRDFTVVNLAVPRMRNAAPALARYLRRSHADALITAMWPLTVIAPFAARLAGFRGRVLVTEHAMLSQQYAPRGGLHGLALRTSTFLAYRLASDRVGVSHGACADMAALSYMASNRFVTIYNPIRPAVRPTAEDLSKAHALWKTDGPRFLTVGNLKPEKNHSLLLHAFAATAHPSSRMMILGQGQNEAALRAIAKDLKITNRVIFAGFQTDPSPFYATADVFALSSDHEGFGNVIVEALSFGLPVVSTNCPSGPAEILQGGRFGALVPVGDAPSLTQAMDAALDAPVDRAALIRRAADFAPEIAALRYLELIDLT